MIKRIGGMLIASCGALGMCQQANALSIEGTGGHNYGGISASQTIFPMLRASGGYTSTKHHGHHSSSYYGSLMFSPYVPGIDVGVGARYQYLDTHYGSGGGVGIGGYAYVPTPIPRVTVGGFGYYTPNGLTHGNLEDSYELGAQARFKVISQTYAYVGYRYMNAKFDHRDSHTLFKGPQIGVSVGF